VRSGPIEKEGFVSADSYLPAPPPASREAAAALILGIVGLLGGMGTCCCCLSLPLALCSPVAALLGYRERIAIREGRSSPAGETMAVAGMVLGIVGSALLVLSVVGLLISGLLSGFGTLLEGVRSGRPPFR
jgi:hypothetical protein